MAEFDGSRIVKRNVPVLHGRLCESESIRCKSKGVGGGGGTS